MKGLILLTANIFRRMIRRPLWVIIRFAISAVVVVAFLFLFHIRGNDIMHIGVTDQDYTPSSKAVMANFKDNPGFKVYEMGEDDLKWYVKNEDLAFGFLIPDGFEDGLISSNTLPVRIISTKDDEDMNWLKNIIELQVEGLNTIAIEANFMKEVYRDLLRSSLKGASMIREEIVKDRAHEKNRLLRTMGIYLLIIMFSVSTVAFRIVEEKRSGIYGRIAFSPLPVKYYTLSNILVSLFATVLQILFVLAVLRFILHLNLYSSLMDIFVILVLFAISAISLVVLIASFSVTVSSVSALLSIILTPSCMIAGCLWPVEFMPDYLRRLAYLTPQRWTLDALNILMTEHSLMSILPEMIIICAFSILFCLLAVRRFMADYLRY